MRCFLPSDRENTMPCADEKHVIYVAKSRPHSGRIPEHANRLRLLILFLWGPAGSLITVVLGNLCTQVHCAPVTHAFSL